MIPFPTRVLTFALAPLPPLSLLLNEILSLTLYPVPGVKTLTDPIPLVAIVLIKSSVSSILSETR